MAGGQHNHKRGAPGDKQGHNPVNSRPPEEYIVLIGGPTNTFNAWWSDVNLRPGHPDASRLGGFWAAQPAPRTMREIDYYLGQKPSAVDPAKAGDPKEWQRRGWSETARKDLAARAWDTRYVDARGPETHDRYWGNFIDAAARLYSQSSPLAGPLRRPAPSKDDIVTFMVYAPAYEARQRLDWKASPYNPIHRHKHGIKGNPLYDPTATRGSDPVNLREYYPDLDKPITYTEHDKREQEKLRQKEEEARRNYKDQPLSDTDIDHYILMRTTSENQGRIIKRPPTNYAYFDYLEDVLRNAVKVKGTMTKILFFSHPNQVIHYIGSGKWVGEQRKGMVDESEIEELAREEERRKKEIEEKAEHLQNHYDADMGSRYGLENYTFFPPPPVTRDRHGRPLKWTLHWNRLWNGAPAVDRSRIKIARLDYFGHSAEDTMMLEWGWTNQKGQVPNLTQDPVTKKTVDLTSAQLAFSLKYNVASNAFATLWGCHMGNEFGPNLADYFGEGVVAAETYTDFEKLIHNESNMPVPVDGQQWFRYRTPRVGAPARAPAGATAGVR